MRDKLKLLSMLDITHELLIEKKGPMTIQKIFEQVSKIKGIAVDDTDKLLELYMDITQSAKFVYCGADQWDLKERNLELWDKDGYTFAEFKEIEKIEETEEEVEEDIEFTEYTHEPKAEKPVEEDEDEKVEVKTEEEKAEIKEEEQYIEIEISTKTTDEDTGDDESEVQYETDKYDEDNYNEIMDDYEDMYDKE